MRTTLDLPKDLIESAMQITEFRTKTELIKFALNDLIRKNKLEQIIKFHGKIDLDIDMDSMRKR